MSFLPFLLNYSKYTPARLYPFSSAVLWLKYAMAIDDIPMCAVNAIGLVVSVFVAGVFYLLSPHKGVLENWAIVVFTYLTMLLMSVRMGLVTVSKLGAIATFGSLITMISPLSTVIRVLKLRTSEAMSLPFILMSLVSSLAWAAYGWERNDQHVVVPNLIGVILSLIQLSLYYAFQQKQANTLRDSYIPLGSI